MNLGAMRLVGRTGRLLEAAPPREGRRHSDSRTRRHRVNSLAETDHSGTIYTTEVGKHYEPECAFYKKSWSLNTSHGQNPGRVWNSSCKGSGQPKLFVFQPLKKRGEEGKGS